MFSILIAWSWIPFFGSSYPAGPTLFPEEPGNGEVVTVLVGGAVLSDPSAEADTVRRVEPGALELVQGWDEGEHGVWVRLGEEAWIEASRVDRPAEPLDGDPEPGREGMASGRVLPFDWRPTDLVSLPDSLKAPGFEGKNLRLRAAAAVAFTEMVAAARADGVEFAAFSAFRTAGDQRRLYRRAVQRHRFPRGTAAPGRSEHQLGTTVDVVSPLRPPLDASLDDTPAGRWLERHAEEYGFVMTFSRHRHEERGVIYEPWHFRWVGSHVSEPSGW